ncbi:hypothetical protein DPMN_153567 [Dreissena polymorpha]|uniref:Uncharacterized protein n=1 Tax=Dreissena polymorpha TaxID=45954 RepID=A0A9D4FJE3_DREPO|nr:hypothetical protein DPMN_153567 [Dreissena polymorpha]
MTIIPIQCITDRVTRFVVLVDGVWTTWSSWTTCRVTCGGGTGTRNRTCQFPPGVPHGHPCMGKVSETRDCSTNLCPGL